MKNLILILSVIIIFSCKKQDEVIVKSDGNISVYTTDSSRIWYIEVDNGSPKTIKRYYEANPSCGSSSLTTINLSEGNHSIKVYSNSGCSNASGFTQTFYMNPNNCKLSRIFCYSYEL